MARFLCKTTDINDPGSKGFEIKTGRKTTELFIVHKDGRFFAYIDSCPHTGAPLEWQQDQFLDLDGELIQCAIHDARFLIESGDCIAGPCQGERLEALPLLIENDKIYLDR